MGLKLRKRIHNAQQLEHFNTGYVGALNGLNTSNPLNISDKVDRISMANGTMSGPSSTLWTDSGYGADGKMPLGNGGGGSLSAGAGWGGAVQGIAQGAQSGFLIAANNAAANAQVRNSNELQQVAGTYEAQGSGYSYTRLNNVDEASENKRMDDINTKTTLTNTAIGIGGGAAAGLGVGAAIGGVAGPIGAGIGAVVGGLAGLFTGIFSGKSRKRKLLKAIVNALNTINRNNNFYQASALSDYLANQYQLNHTNTQDDALYTAKHGKDLRQPIRKK